MFEELYPKDAMKESKKAVVFDLDGTLIDTSIDIANACNKALRSENLPEFPLSEFRKIVGWGLKQTMLLATPEEFRHDEKLQRILHEKQISNYNQAPCEKTLVYPGIEKLLQFLVKRQIPIAVWTNKDDDIAKKVIKSFFPDTNFKIIVGNIKGRPAKPDPSASELIVKDLSLSPDQVLYVGDSDVDMITASKSGFYPLGVTWGYRSKEELLNAGAKTLADKALDIYQYFI